MGLRRLPIHQAFHQPILLGGAERAPAITLGSITLALAFNGATIVAIVIAAVLWFVGFPLLRQAAKADAKMFEVYRRAVRYQGHYPPRSTPWRVG